MHETRYKKWYLLFIHLFNHNLWIYTCRIRHILIPWIWFFIVWHWHCAFWIIYYSNSKGIKNQYLFPYIYQAYFNSGDPCVDFSFYLQSSPWILRVFNPDLLSCNDTFSIRPEKKMVVDNWDESNCYLFSILHIWNPSACIFSKRNF